MAKKPLYSTPSPWASATSSMLAAASAPFTAESAVTTMTAGAWKKKKSSPTVSLRAREENGSINFLPLLKTSTGQRLRLALPVTQDHKAHVLPVAAGVGEAARLDDLIEDAVGYGDLP
jgi:hypothetical protein